MIKSTSITNLAKALILFRVKVENIKKDATNPFFKSKYASLSTILDAINDPLNESGCPVQELGIMSLEEYWSTSRNPIEKDLYDYIITNMVDQRRMLHVAFKEIESILLTHTL